MHEPDLVGIHEARIAHHVAAVRQIDGQDRSAAVLNGAGAVVVELLVVVGADVAAREALFQVPEEGRVDGHHVFKVAVLRAILHHQDLAVALDNLRLDLADFLVQQDFVRQLTVDDLLADFRNATRDTGNRFRAASRVAASSFPRTSAAACRTISA